jgi:hypothetical protein
MPQPSLPFGEVLHRATLSLSLFPVLRCTPNLRPVVPDQARALPTVAVSYRCCATAVRGEPSFPLSPSSSAARRPKTSCWADALKAVESPVEDPMAGGLLEWRVCAPRRRSHAGMQDGSAIGTPSWTGPCCDGCIGPRRTVLGNWAPGLSASQAKQAEPATRAGPRNNFSPWRQYK